jgi:hypothetical protein
MMLIQVIREPIERLEPNFTAGEIDIAIKNEPEDTSNIDFEANYGEKLMSRKLQVKVELVDSFDQETLIDTEVMTEVKTEKEFRNNVETPSLELTSESNEESFGEPVGIQDTVNINVLDKLVKDTSTIHPGAQTENIGDAWFKKISEIERKKFTCHICLSVFEKFGLFVNHQRARHGIVESKKHGENYECALCGYESKDLEFLIFIHMKTCEIYICEICDEKIPHIPNVMAHFEVKHNVSKHKGYPNGVRHVKPSRENSEVYDNKFHSYQSLFSLYKKWK